MSQVMRGLHWKRCLVYIDDILVFGNDFESALHSLELVLIRVAEYGLQLKSTKCNLFRSSVPFLGHIVGRAGLECDPNKVSAVANWIPPSTIKGVREFLGFTGYYRRFVPDYSTVAQSLVRLLGKDCKFKWTDACQDAFMALRALLTKNEPSTADSRSSAGILGGRTEPQVRKRLVPCVETRTSRHKDLDHHSHQPSSSSPRNTVCVLSDHQPANHKEFELSVIGGITEETTVKTGKSKEHCAQDINSEFEDARTQKNSSESNTVRFEGQNEHCAQVIMSEFEAARTQKMSSESNTVVIEAEIHADNTDSQYMAQLEEAQDFSDAGSLTTQAPQSQSIHATINALSSWVSAIQPRESWYLAGWIGDSSIDFLVDPGAVVSAISLQSYEKLMESNAKLTPMKAIHMELEAANKSDMSVHGMCNLDLSVHGLIINMDALVVDLNCHAILGMDILGDASKLPFILDLVKGTLSGGGYETIQLHRFQAATECFAETTDSVCIPPHSEVMLWAKLKTNNGRRGPTAGVVLALQTFVQEFGLLVGRSLVCADADDWKIPILIYNSDPCTMKPADCTCNPVIIPAHTRIARVEEIQVIQHIGCRETEMNTEEGALPPHLIDVLDAATELTSNQRARAAALLAKHVNTFPAPGTPITGRTEAVMHDIDTGSTRPIRCNPRKLSPKKIKIQQ